MAVVRYALPSDPLHLKLAFRTLGLREAPGAKNNPEIVKLFAEAGFPGIKLDSVPWCAAWLGAMLRRARLPSSNSLAARSYLQWGKTTTKPKRGDVCVFSRGSDWQGHVNLFLGEEGGRVWGLGANQSDAVTVAAYPKSRLLGYRTPITLTNTRAAKGLGLASGGVVTAGVGEGMQQWGDSLTEAGGVVQMLAMVSPWFMVLGAVLTLAGIAWAAWDRMHAWRQKGR